MALPRNYGGRPQQRPSAETGSGENKNNLRRKN
jgi:hypothetical protein